MIFFEEGKVFGQLVIKSRSNLGKAVSGKDFLNIVIQGFVHGTDNRFLFLK